MVVVLVGVADSHTDKNGMVALLLGFTTSLIPSVMTLGIPARVVFSPERCHIGLDWSRVATYLLDLSAQPVAKAACNLRLPCPEPSFDHKGPSIIKLKCTESGRRSQHQHDREDAPDGALNRRVRRDLP